MGIFAVATLLLQVVYGAAITFAEGMPVVVHELTLYAGMLVPVMIIGIAVRARVEVVSGSFYSVAESGACRFAIFRWRFVPTALPFILSR
jgi:hypothetical protein